MSFCPTSQKNAQKGLCISEMSMVRCYKEDNSYHFELQERIEVAISASNKPTCSVCPSSEGRACRHVWWVDDQVLAYRAPPQETYRYEVSRSGDAFRSKNHPGSEMTFFELLEGSRGWRVRPSDNNQDERRIERMTADVLSAFDPSSLDPDRHDSGRLAGLQQNSQ